MEEHESPNLSSIKQLLSGPYYKLAILSMGACSIFAFHKFTVYVLEDKVTKNVYERLEKRVDVINNDVINVRQNMINLHAQINNQWVPMITHTDQLNEMGTKLDRQLKEMREHTDRKFSDLAARNKD